ncbi:MAG TPA: hypothetical protein VNO50_19590 [Pyrinomonadaceae bacterium]|nr:hypothetical protein [Pyrinomonadaceae bacterium]
MKKSIKRSLIIVALALVAFVSGLIWIVSRPEELDEPFAESVLDTSRGPSFEVRVVVPRMARPLGGILPDWIVAKMDGTPSELRFDHTSRGAQFGIVGHDRVELKADEWDFSIETDAEGLITPATRLVFPLALGGRHLRLNCRPANPATGYLRTASRAGSAELGGRFVVELARCTNAESGKTTNWPPAPLTVRGSFVGSPAPSPESKRTAQESTTAK